MLWVTDADNTLWDTDAVYRQAQLRLFADVEQAVGREADAEDRLSYLRSIDQAIARQDHRGLKYPPAMLVSALAQRLCGASVEEATKFVLRGRTILDSSKCDDIVTGFNVNLSESPLLRKGVRTGFELLEAAHATVFVVTEGPKARVEQTLHSHGLERIVYSLLSAEKTETLFARISRLKPGGVRWAIGDQLDKDVLPAIGAGFHAIHFPGGFNPAWAALPREPNPCYVIVDDYAHAVKIATIR